MQAVEPELQSVVRPDTTEHCTREHQQLLGAASPHRTAAVRRQLDEVAACIGMRTEEVRLGDDASDAATS